MTDPVFNNSIINLFGLTGVGSAATPTLVDIDSDGDLDAFIGRQDGYTQFFHNIGTASSAVFVASGNLALANFGLNASPHLVDIDGDGDLDVFIGRQDGNTQFFRNIGTVSNAVFASEPGNFGLSNVGGYASPTFADIDGDGDLDAFVGNKAGNTLFFRNAGTVSNAVFVASSNFGLINVGGYASPTFADVDNDGDLDAFVGNQEGNTLFFRNTGTVSNAVFASEPGNFGLSNVGGYASPSFADIDNDGDLDAFVGNQAGNTLFFLNNQAAVRIIQSSGDTAVTEGGATDSYTVVLNRAPTADVIITLDTTNHQVSGNVTSLTFTASNWNTPQTVTVSAVNDTVGEGRHTGVILHTATSSDTAYNGISVNKVIAAVTDNDMPLRDPSFNTPSDAPFSFLIIMLSFTSPSLVDIDGDGDLDAFVGKVNGDIQFFRNTGTVGSASFVSESGNFGLGKVGLYASPCLVDIDSDGDLDAFVGDWSGNTQFFRNTGTGSNAVFTAESSNFGLTDVGSYASPSLVDIDGDGDLDAFVGNDAGNTLFFRNTGTANSAVFTAESSNFGLTDVGSYASPALVDIDGDGDLDAFIGNDAGDTLFFRNTGTVSNAVFTAASSNFGLTYINTHASPTFADIDGDGDLDAFVGNSLGNTMFYLNDSKPTLTTFAAVVASGNEDSEMTISFANLQSQGDEADDDGTVTAFVIKAVSTGTLKIGVDAVSATAWDATTNNTVDASHQAYWMPALNANGVLNAFTVAAKDNTGLESITTIQATVAVIAIADTLVLTTPTAINYFDTAVVDSFTMTSGSLAVTTDGGVLTYGITGGTDNLDGTISKSNLYGKLTVTQATGAYRFDANSAAIEPLTANASDFFVVTVSSGLLIDRKTLTINITQTGKTESILNDVLIGTAGDDTINGLTGADNMQGGLGNDTYIVDNLGDVVFEAVSVGTDSVNSSVSFTLSANLENLTLTGTAAINGTGNARDNVLTGNGAANTLNGGSGIDTMNAWDGDDTYIVDNTADVVVELYNDTFSGIDTVLSSVSYVLSNNIENLTLTGTAANATGNALDNTLTGNAAANTLDGGIGADKLIGGLGDDVYFIDTGDVIIENLAAGIDRVESSISYTLGANLENLTLTGTAVNATGNTLNNILTGNAEFNTLNGLAGNDTLDGGAGADTLIGGLGNDIYVIDDAGDVVTENALAGIDTVKSSIDYTLLADLENLTLTGMAVNGIGNALNNLITGNAEANTFNGLAGNDTLDGGAGADRLDGGVGADRLIGGLGNDTYIVDNIGDLVTESSLSTAEIDSVESSITYTLGANLENLTLTGTAVINGTGNTLNNRLTGNDANNILSGGAGVDSLDAQGGADTLIGGLGKDNYQLAETAAATDIVRIAAGDSLIGGYDTVSGFALGTGIISTAGVDKLDLFNTLIATNAAAVDGINSGTVLSHHIRNGIISFDDTNAYAAPLTITAATNLDDVFDYLQANITGGKTVAFVSEGNTFVFQDGGVRDTLVELVGVTASSINTTGLAMDSVWIA